MKCQYTPRCPWCNTARHVRESNANLHAFYCGKCGREFEDVDDGDIAYGRPDRRLIRQENAKDKKGRKHEHSQGRLSG